MTKRSETTCFKNKKNIQKRVTDKNRKRAPKMNKNYSKRKGRNFHDEEPVIGMQVTSTDLVADDI